MDSDIGIIGISGILPRARNLQIFRKNLYEGKDCITKAPSERLKLLGLDEEQEYMQLGFIDDIEYFDHAFFNISNKEADYMSPEQRLSLELVAETILDAGYSLEQFRGKNCAVIVSCSDNEYEGLLKSRTSLSFIGSLKSMTSGIIAYYFDLHGPNIILDTGCSSTLVGIHEACLKLNTHEVDYAIAGGIAVSLTLAERNAGANDILGIESSDGRCKSFDWKANGTGFGEGGGYLLLKRFKEAVQDRDHIYGIIKGSAINSDGFRCSSITTPSVQGQKEVIIKAWQAGNINSEEITEIEAHGTGTKLGDPIEVSSMTETLKAFNVTNRVHLGSVKSNIGHLGYTAGIAGVLKVLMGFKYHEVYPIANYERPNPLINFENSPLQPTTKVYTCEPKAKRIAGINSFGLSGTNAHMIIENYYTEQTQEELSGQARLLKLSAKSETAFYKTLSSLKNYFEKNIINLNDALYTLNTGRDDYKFRRLLRVSDLENLIEQLDMAAYAQEIEETKLVFVLTSHEEDNNQGDDFGQRSPLFQSYCENQLGRLKAKVGMYQYLKALGIEADYVMADAVGKSIIQYGRGEITQKDLGAELEKKEEYSDSSAKILEQIGLLSEKNHLLIVNMGNARLDLQPEYVHEVKEFRLDSFLELEKLLIALYNSGRNICWDKYYEGLARKRVALPTYCFDKIKHWLELKNPTKHPDQDVRAEESSADFNKLPLTGDSGDEVSTLKTIWKDVLEYKEEIGDDEDFFDLGGNSLLITILTEDIERILHVKIDVAQVYDYNTIEKQAELIKSKKDTARKSAAGRGVLVNASEKKESYSLSSMQKTILYSQEKYPDRASWNLSIALRVAGQLDCQRMVRAMRKVEGNHDLLRCIIAKTEDGVVFKPHKHENNLDIISLKENKGTLEEKEAYVRGVVKEEAIKPIELYNHPLANMVIYSISENLAYMLLKIHHIIADGWALSILFNELCQYYMNPDYVTSEPIVQFREFVDYESSTLKKQKGEDELNYWEKEMSDFQYQKELPVKNKELITSVISVEYLLLDMKTTKNLRDYVKEKRASVFHALLMTYHLSLATIFGMTDSCIGMMVANRNNKRFATTLGLLARVLPNRIHLDKLDSIDALLKTVKEKSARAQENQQCSVNEAMEGAIPKEKAAFDDLVPFLIVYQNFGEINIEVEGLKFTTFITNERSALCPLALIIYESEKVIMVSIEYDPGYFTVADIKLFTKTFQDIINKVLDNPGLSVQDLLS